MPSVLNKRAQPYVPGSVYIGRGSPYGNPFKIGEHGTRDEVCDRFEREILPTLDVRALRGKDLVCFCAPLRCHGDAILRKANETCARCGNEDHDPDSGLCDVCAAAR